MISAAVISLNWKTLFKIFLSAASNPVNSPSMLIINCNSSEVTRLERCRSTSGIRVKTNKKRVDWLRIPIKGLKIREITPIGAANNRAIGSA